MENTYTVQNAFELVADPVQFPITIGNEHFLVTQQDRRSILDRRTWQLVRIFPTLESPDPLNLCHSNQIPLQQVIQQLLALFTFYPNPTTTVDRTITGVALPIKLRYEKQTSIDDLIYDQRRSCLNVVAPAETPVVSHVHFVVDRGQSDKASNTEEDARITKQTVQPMEYDPGEGTSGMRTNFSNDHAYDLMKLKKKNDVFFW